MYKLFLLLVRLLISSRLLYLRFWGKVIRGFLISRMRCVSTLLTPTVQGPAVISGRDWLGKHGEWSTSEVEVVMAVSIFP